MVIVLTPLWFWEWYDPQDRQITISFVPKPEWAISFYPIVFAKGEDGNGG